VGEKGGGNVGVGGMGWDGMGKYDVYPAY